MEENAPNGRLPDISLTIRTRTYYSVQKIHLYVYVCERIFRTRTIMVCKLAWRFYSVISGIDEMPHTARVKTNAFRVRYFQDRMDHQRRHPSRLKSKIRVHREWIIQFLYVFLTYYFFRY